MEGWLKMYTQTALVGEFRTNTCVQGRGMAFKFMGDQEEEKRNIETNYTEKFAWLKILYNIQNLYQKIKS